MLNTWVKNVNNQWFKNSITSDYITTDKLLNQSKQKSCSQKLYLLKLKTFIYTVLSTYKNMIFNLLNKSYTVNPQSLLLRPLNEI